MLLVGGAISPSWKMMEFVNGEDDNGWHPIYEMDNKSHVPVTTDVRIFQQALESLDHGDLGIPHFRKLPFVAMETEEHHQTSNKQGMIGVVKTWNQMLQVPGAKIPLFQNIIQMWRSIPIGSMYAIYGNIYHQYTPNVSIYTIHGSYGIEINQFLFQKKKHPNPWSRSDRAPISNLSRAHQDSLTGNLLEMAQRPQVSLKLVANCQLFKALGQLNFQALVEFMAKGQGL